MDKFNTDYFGSSVSQGPETREDDAAIDTGDHVHHAPTGEDWVVARATTEHVWPCGWPPTRAATTDCRVIRWATDAERRKLLDELARGGSEHAAYARSRTFGRTSKAHSNEKESSGGAQT